jgi:hypothetical protein
MIERERKKVKPEVKNVVVKEILEANPVETYKNVAW